MFKFIVALAGVLCVVQYTAANAIDERALFNIAGLAATGEQAENVEEVDDPAALGLERRHYSNDNSDWHHGHHRELNEDKPKGLDVEQRHYSHDNSWDDHHHRRQVVANDPIVQVEDIPDVQQQYYHDDFSYDIDHEDVRGATACNLCRTWYQDERRDLTWLTKVNQEIKCPCTARSTGRGGYTPTDPKLVNDWEPDYVCTSYGRPYCSIYHPGASGCMKSITTTSTGARQQCCYNSQGGLLPPTHPGAGTPDRASGRYDHQSVDLQPYKWCCHGCGQAQYCNYYKEVRKGSSAHCK